MNLTNIPDCFNVNGKTLTKPERNLVAKLQTNYDFDVAVPPEGEVVTRRNRVTGMQSGPLNPLVAALVDFIYECYDAYESNGNYVMSFNGKKVAIGIFDRVKYLVLRLDSNAYSELVD